MAGSSRCDSEFDFHLRKDPGRARTTGAEFEFKLAALLYLRAKAKPGLHFQLASNVKEANPIDDLFLRIKWQNKTLTYFFQLKHSEKRKAVKPSDLLSDRGDFSIKKYFDCYKKFRELSKQTNTTVTENFLFDNENDIRFVIFTNRPVQHNEFKFCDTDFQFAELFVTRNDYNQVFCFTEHDKEVWNLCDKSEEDMFRYQFLPRLLVCSEQVDAKDLESLIQDQLNAILRNKVVRQEPLYKLLLSYFYNWWDEDNVPCLSDMSLVMEEIIIEDNGKAIREDLSSYPVSFTSSACKELTQRISEATQALHVISAGVSEILRCARFQQCIESTYKTYCLFLRPKTLNNYPFQLIETICGICEFVIVIADTLSSDMQELLVKIPCNTRLIFATSNLEPTWQRFFKCYSPQFIQWDDIWTFEHFDEDTQARLIQDANVSFQGYNISMKEIQTVWPSLVTNISEMIDVFVTKSSRTASMGNALPSLTNLYQRRSLQHSTTLKMDVFDELPETEHLVLTGFTKEKFPKLYEKARTQNITFVNENDDQNYDFKSVRKNVHFLDCLNDDIIWKKTEGCKNEIIQYVTKKNEFCVGLPMCCHSQDVDSLMNWKDRIILIIGEPGIGKTTFLTRLAHTLKANRPVQWVVPLLMKSLEGILQRFNTSKEISSDDVIDMLAEAVGIVGSPYEHTAREFLKFSVNSGGNVVVMVDAVDEVCPAFKDTTLQVIKSIAKTKVSQVWVTARTNLDYELRNEFSTVPLTFLPFTKEDQIKYMRKYLQKTESNMTDDSELQEIFEMLHGMNDQVGQSLVDVPLHVVMIAEIYEECRHIIASSESRRLHPIYLPQLYKMFVDKKIRLFQLKHDIDEELLVNTSMFKHLQRDFAEMHMNSAMVYLFDGQECLNLKNCKKFLSKEKEDFDKEKTGIIIDFIDGKPIFVHRSLAEYFAAQWLAENYKTCIDFCKKEFFHDGLTTVRMFFDSFLAEGFPLHEAVLEESMDHMKTLLEDGLDVNQRDAGGRLALHLAASYGLEGATEILLESGSDINAKDYVLEWTPLNYADKALELCVVKHLVNLGASHKDTPFIFSVVIDYCIQEMRSEIRYSNKKKNNYFKNFLLNMRFDTKAWLVWKSYIQNHNDFPMHTRSRREETEILKKVLDITVDKTTHHVIPLFYTVTDGCTRMIVFALSCGKRKWRPRENPTKICIRSVKRIADSLPSTHVWEVSIPLHAGWRKDILLLVTFLFPGREEKERKEKRKANTSFSDLLLVLVAGINDYASMKGLLECGMRINVRDDLEITPIHWAACNARTNDRMLRLLLENRTDCNSKDYLKRTSCHWLFGAGDFERRRWSQYNENETQFFEKFRGNPNTLVLKMVRAGAKFSVRDYYGRLPLHYASARDDFLTCSLLMSASDAGVTYEELEHQIEVESEKCAHARVSSWDMKDKFSCTPLYYAVVFDRIEVVRLFLKHGADASWRESSEEVSFWEDIKRPSLLHVACHAGSYRVVEELINNWNFQVDEKDDNGLTPLHYLCITFSRVSRYSEILRREMGSDQTWRSIGKENIFSFLHAHGADVHVQNIFLRTPLHYASWYGTDCLLKALVESGVSIDTKDITGRTALNIASEERQVLAIKVLLQLGADCGIKDYRGRTPLFNAARMGCYEILENFCDAGADINTTTDDGTTPLMAASRNGHCDVVDFLLRKGVAKSMTNEYGQSALHLAALSGELEILNILLKVGIDVNLKDKKGFTVLHYAQRDNEEEVAALLKQYGAEELKSNDEVSQEIKTTAKDVLHTTMAPIDESCFERTYRNWKQCCVL